MKKNIMLLFGGRSSEHEVSKLSAKAVLKNIDVNKYNVIPVGITREGIWLKYDGDISEIDKVELDELMDNKISLPLYNLSEKKAENEISDKYNNTALSEIDVIFPLLHGPNGEDGTVQGLCELLDIPYVGCGVLASAACMDKAFAKIVFERAGIPMGRYKLLTRADFRKSMKTKVLEIENEFSYPLFIKPANAGSSVGVSKVKNRHELEKGIETAARYDTRILVEEELYGKEIECAVLGNDDPIASVTGEIKPCNDFYDYEAKYLAGESETIIPADIPFELSEKVREYAVRAHTALCCSGLSRVDFFVDRDKNEIKIIEINTMPGFTDISMYSKLWAASGIPYADLIDRLIGFAEERYRENKRDFNM